MTRKFRLQPLDFRVFIVWGLLAIGAIALAQPVPIEIFKGLSSEKFAEREAAQEDLLNWSRRNPRSSLKEMYRQSLLSEDPEIRTRCSIVLKQRVLEAEYFGGGFLGIGMFEMTVNLPGDPEPRRVIRIERVQPGTAAEKAGLQPNQLIVALGNRIWRDHEMVREFSRIILDTPPGTEVTLTVLEGENLLEKKIRLGARPELPGEEEKELIQGAKDRFFQRWLDKQEAGAR